MLNLIIISGKYLIGITILIIKTLLFGWNHEQEMNFPHNGLTAQRWK